MATIHLCSINDRPNHIGTVYTMTMLPLRSHPELVYSGVALLKPTKAMVYGHKHNDGDQRFTNWTKYTDEEYRLAYLAIVEAQMDLIKLWYAGLAAEEELTLCCYCAKDKFCHRQFVAKTFKWLNNHEHIGNHDIHLF